jgi:hypothetical protein
LITEELPQDQPMYSPFPGEFPKINSFRIAGTLGPVVERFFQVLTPRSTQCTNPRDLAYDNGHLR